MNEHKYIFLNFVMKKDFLFWSMIALIVAFYLTIGNEMHVERKEMINNIASHQELNSTK